MVEQLNFSNTYYIMGTFNLDEFIAQVNSDKTKSRSNKDRLNRVLMQTKDNQGTLTFIPVFSNATKGFYLKLPRVYEYYGSTSKIQSGEAWYRVLPFDMYGQLTESQLELYNEVKGYLDYLNDNELVGRDEFRVRNYSLFYGMCISLKNTEGKKIEDYVDCPCLFVYPSNSVIDQLGTAINNKIDTMKGKKEWLMSVFNPGNKGWEGVIQISFTKSAGVGYDSAVNFEFNSNLNTVVDSDLELPEETMKEFDEILPTFLGWIYDRDNKSLFNEIAFKELRDQLKLRIKAIKEGEPQPAEEPAPENKNNLAPEATAEAPKPKTTPF